MPDAILGITGNNDYDYGGEYSPLIESFEDPNDPTTWQSFKDMMAESAAHSGDIGLPDYRPTGTPGFNLSKWLKENSTTVYIVSAGLVAMALLGGKRR